MLMCASGVKLEDSVDAIPWYGGKLEIAHYLEDLNKEKKVCITLLAAVAFLDANIIL